MTTGSWHLRERMVLSQQGLYLAKEMVPVSLTPLMWHLAAKDAKEAYCLPRSSAPTGSMGWLPKR